jgi:hypothetical protein
MRQTIERAFGLMTNRFGIFWRPLRCSYKYWPLVCMVAAKLHNFCIDNNIPLTVERVSSDHQEGDSNITLSNENSSSLQTEGSSRNSHSGCKRKQFTEDLERQGTRRPIFAMCNSRENSR